MCHAAFCRRSLFCQQALRRWMEGFHTAQVGLRHAACGLRRSFRSEGLGSWVLRGMEPRTSVRGSWVVGLGSCGGASAPMQEQTFLLATGEPAALAAGDVEAWRLGGYRAPHGRIGVGLRRAPMRLAPRSFRSGVKTNANSCKWRAASFSWRRKTTECVSSDLPGLKSGTCLAS